MTFLADTNLLHLLSVMVNPSSDTGEAYRREMTFTTSLPALPAGSRNRSGTDPKQAPPGLTLAGHITPSENYLLVT